MYEVVYRKHLRGMRRCFECLKTLRKSLHSRLCLFLLSSANRSPFLACTFNVCWLSLCLGVVVKQAIWLIAAVYPYCQYCASKDLAWWFCTVGQKCSVYPCPSTPYDVILCLSRAMQWLGMPLSLLLILRS